MVLLCPRCHDLIERKFHSAITNVRRKAKPHLNPRYSRRMRGLISRFLRKKVREESLDSIAVMESLEGFLDEAIPEWKKEDL